MFPFGFYERNEMPGKERERKNKEREKLLEILQMLDEIEGKFYGMCGSVKFKKI